LGNTLIGANGAGKRTSLRTISGIVHPAARRGSGGRDIPICVPMSGPGVELYRRGCCIFLKFHRAREHEIGAECQEFAKINARADEMFQLFPRLMNAFAKVGRCLAANSRCCQSRVA
jgi:branched-chain amino acid transport system ATP-binding protein